MARRLWVALASFLLGCFLISNGLAVPTSTPKRSKASKVKSLKKCFDGCWFCRWDGPCFSCEYGMFEPGGRTGGDDCEVINCVICAYDPPCTGVGATTKLQQQETAALEGSALHFSDEEINSLARRNPRMAVTLFRLNGRKYLPGRSIYIKWIPVSVSTDEVKYWLDTTTIEAREYHLRLRRQAAELRRKKVEPILMEITPTSSSVTLKVLSGAIKGQRLATIPIVSS